MAVPKKRIILILVFAVVVIALIIISMSKLWVENNYTYGVYPYTSRLQRWITGSIPFSIGDIVYIIFICWVTYKIIRNIWLLFVRRLTIRIAFRKFSKFILLLLYLYVFFLLVWGLNYSRKGIRYQLSLEPPVNEQSDLLNLQSLLLAKVNDAKARLVASEKSYPPNKDMFQRAVYAFDEAQDSFPFLKYTVPSIKPSIFGSLWSYMGFTGYYNPFSGEAQVNTSVPRFLIPAITVHEMAHQIGYAKENEANFVGFLVGSHSSDPLFSYSSWLDLFMYTNVQVRQYDSASGNAALLQLDPSVRQDIIEWRQFSEQHRSFMEPVMHWVYGKYLELNKQAQGMKSYDAVVSLVMAYYKKEHIL